MKNSIGKRNFNGERLYKLTKWVVIVVSIIALFLAVSSYMDVVNNTTLHSWEDYCKQHPDISNDPLYSCMATGLIQVDWIQNAMYKEFVIGIFLPLVFFGSTGLYKYLFPKKKNE